MGETLPDPHAVIALAIKYYCYYYYYYYFCYNYWPKEGHHITCSAITSDGTLVAASDLSGTRLFHLNLGELEARGWGDLYIDVNV